jgi:A/G-specific adenine glycosylase
LLFKAKLGFSVALMRIDIPKFRRDLLRWYGGAKRDLPWRRTQDPYAILVSELMLQQTQVKTALPYYEKFLARFPDARSLAAATEEAVLAAWAGLGYYRRARFLQAAAKAIDAAGSFPDTLDGIRALPGVGAYTAAAVGSIAFGLSAVVVDGNVIRVVSRLLALDEDPTKGPGAERLRLGAQELLDPRRPGDFNQALMELGAGICAPSKPRCPDCPLRAHCAAFLADRTQDFPRLPARTASRTLVKAALLLTQGAGSKAKVLARARKPTEKPKPGQAADRLQGFWAFPETELKAENWAQAEAWARKEALRLAGPGRCKPAGRLPKVRHRITIYDIHVLPLRYTAKAAGTGRSPAAVAAEKALQKAGWIWVPMARLGKLPLASAERKLLEHLNGALAPRADEGAQMGLGL